MPEVVFPLTFVLQKENSLWNSTTTTVIIIMQLLRLKSMNATRLQSNKAIPHTETDTRATTNTRAIPWKDSGKSSGCRSH